VRSPGAGCRPAIRCSARCRGATALLRLQIGGQPDRRLPVARSDLGLSVRVSRAAPDAAFAAVVERGLALEDEVDRPAQAPCRSQQHALGLVVGRCSAMGARSWAIVAPWADQENIAHHRPARRGVPGRLEHQRSGQITPVGRDGHVRRSQPEPSGVSIEHRREDARAVHPRQAHPLHTAARRDERAHLAIGYERVVGDRRKRTSTDRRPRRAGRISHWPPCSGVGRAVG
jgi:hypothetical protein